VSLYTAYALSAHTESQYGVVIVVLLTVFVFTPQTPDTKHWPSLGRNVYQHKYRLLTFCVYNAEGDRGTWAHPF